MLFPNKTVEHPLTFIILWLIFRVHTCLANGLVEPAPPLGLRAHSIWPLDFFLWGYVEDAVYVPPLPQDINDLKDRIRRAVAATERHMLQIV
jgi:hypothetical protein